MRSTTFKFVLPAVLLIACLFLVQGDKEDLLQKQQKVQIENKVDGNVNRQNVIHRGVFENEHGMIEKRLMREGPKAVPPAPPLYPYIPPETVATNNPSFSPSQAVGQIGLKASTPDTVSSANDRRSVSNMKLILARVTCFSVFFANMIV